MSMICEHLMNEGQCLPLNAFNIGPTRGSVMCQSVGCEDTCPVRALMIDHNQKRARIQMIPDPYHQLEQLTAAIDEAGCALQALPNLAGIRSLGARFV